MARGFGFKVPKGPSLRRMSGTTSAKRRIAKATGIPMVVSRIFRTFDIFNYNNLTQGAKELVKLINALMESGAPCTT